MPKPSLLEYFTGERQRAEHLQRTSKSLPTLEAAAADGGPASAAKPAGPGEAAGQSSDGAVGSAPLGALHSSQAADTAASGAAGGPASGAMPAGAGPQHDWAPSGASADVATAGLAKRSAAPAAAKPAGPMLTLSPPESALSGLAASLPALQARTSRTGVQPATSVNLLKWTTMLIVGLVVAYFIYRIYQFLAKRRRKAAEARKAPATTDGETPGGTPKGSEEPAAPPTHVRHEASPYAQRIPSFLGGASPANAPRSGRPQEGPASAPRPAAAAAVKGSERSEAAPSSASRPAPASQPPTPVHSEPTPPGADAAKGASNGPPPSGEKQAAPAQASPSAPKPAGSKKAAPSATLMIEELEEDAAGSGAAKKASGPAETGANVDEFLDRVQRGVGYPAPGQ